MGHPFMRLFYRLVRISVILLLTLRVFASPLAMRPESPQALTKYRLTVRVCAWPAVRPDRSSGATCLVPRSNGPNKDHDWDRSFGLQALFSSVPEILSRPLGPVAQGSHSGRDSVPLRC